MRDEAQLASLDVNALGNGVEAAALVVPSAPVLDLAAVVAAAPGEPAPAPAPAPAAPAPAMRQAAVRMAAATPAPAMVKAAAVHASAPVRQVPSAIAKDRLASAARAREAVAKVRPQAVAMLDNKLLSDNTLGDLLSGARSEAGRRR